MEKRNILKECPNCKQKEGRRKIEAKMFDTGGTNMEKLARLDSDTLKYTKKNSNHA